MKPSRFCPFRNWLYLLVFAKTISSIASVFTYWDSSLFIIDFQLLWSFYFELLTLSNALCKSSKLKFRSTFRLGVFCIFIVSFLGTRLNFRLASFFLNFSFIFFLFMKRLKFRHRILHTTWIFFFFFCDLSFLCESILFLIEKFLPLYLFVIESII